MLPQNRVGLVIGRGGETIREVQDRSGARITIQPEDSMSHLGPDAERIVHLIGDEESIQRAKAMITEMIVTNSRLGSAPYPSPVASGSRPPPSAYGGSIGGSSGIGSSGSSGGGSGGGASTTTAIHVPESSVGSVIGKRAETLKIFQSITNCRIFVDPSSASETPGQRQVRINGAPDAVAYAIQLIMARVTQNEASIANGTGQITGPPMHQPYHHASPQMGHYHQQYASYGAAYPQYAPAAATPALGPASGASGTLYQSASDFASVDPSSDYARYYYQQYSQQQQQYYQQYYQQQQAQQQAQPPSHQYDHPPQ